MVGRLALRVHGPELCVEAVELLGVAIERGPVRLVLGTRPGRVLLELGHGIPRLLHLCDDAVEHGAVPVPDLDEGSSISEDAAPVRLEGVGDDLVRGDLGSEVREPFVAHLAGLAFGGPRHGLVHLVVSGEARCGVGDERIDLRTLGLGQARVERVRQLVGGDGDHRVGQPFVRRREDRDPRGREAARGAGALARGRDLRARGQVRTLVEEECPAEVRELHAVREGDDALVCGDGHVCQRGEPGDGHHRRLRLRRLRPWDQIGRAHV